MAIAHPYIQTVQGSHFPTIHQVHQITYTQPQLMLPKVRIDFCAKCKWHNRAVWYAQEILQTFSDPESNLVAEIALCPSYTNGGLFQVTVENEAGETVIYRRRMKKSADEQAEAYYYDGFPDSKLLKQLIRNALFPDVGLGHVEGKDSLLTCETCKENE